MVRSTAITDALEALHRLTSGELVARLAALRAEEKQLKAALRIVRARERAQASKPPSQEARSAS